MKNKVVVHAFSSKNKTTLEIYGKAREIVSEFEYRGDYLKFQVLCIGNAYKYNLMLGTKPYFRGKPIEFGKHIGEEVVHVVFATPYQNPVKRKLDGWNFVAPTLNLTVEEKTKQIIEAIDNAARVPVHPQCIKEDTHTFDGFVTKMQRKQVIDTFHNAASTSAYIVDSAFRGINFPSGVCFNINNVTLTRPLQGDELGELVGKIIVKKSMPSLRTIVTHFYPFGNNRKGEVQIGAPRIKPMTGKEVMDDWMFEDKSPICKNLIQ